MTNFASIEVTANTPELNLNINDFKDELERLQVGSYDGTHEYGTDEPDIVIDFRTGSFSGNLWFGSIEEAKLFKEQLEFEIEELED